MTRAPRSAPGLQALYNSLLPLLRMGLRAAARRNPKLRETLAGHRGLWQRLEVALAARDPAKPLLWFHVASAGELLQTLPLMERFAADGGQLVLTVTSISGQRWAERQRASLPALLAMDFLPLDTRRNVRRLLRLLRPTALIYTKYDLWPNLVWGAARAGVPQYLLAATLHERSWRFRSRLARRLYRSLYARLAGIFAVTEADAGRFLASVPGHPGVAVVGDPRFDAVLDRRARMSPPELPPYAPGEGAVLVVGSSWPADEQRILPALREALARDPALRVLLVPHEIDARHLATLEADFEGLATVRFSQLAAETPPWRVLLVDAVGVLSALYAHAALAYVGGAFGAGVHNVLEPAAMGVPAIFGPRHHNDAVAQQLLGEGLAFSVSDAMGFRRVLFGLLENATRRAELGEQARAFAEAQGGASQRAYERIRAELADAAAGGATAASGRPRAGG